jgi:hypothetical protein
MTFVEDFTLSYYNHISSSIVPFTLVSSVTICCSWRDGPCISFTRHLRVGRWLPVRVRCIAIFFRLLIVRPVSRKRCETRGGPYSHIPLTILHLEASARASTEAQANSEKKDQIPQQCWRQATKGRVVPGSDFSLHLPQVQTELLL